MNRRERRKKLALARKARVKDFMSHVPDDVRSRPSFQAGMKSVERGELPPAYYEQIEKAAELIFEWHSQQVDPDLRWIEQKNDGVFIAAALCDGAAMLADSPDAFRLLAWLDEKTGRVLSLNQAVWALRRVRALPMPDGSYYGVETKYESRGMALLKSFAAGTGTETRLTASPCGHCGELLDGATAARGVVPAPGDITLCIRCCGVNRYDEEMRLAKVTDEEIEALGAEGRGALRDAQALLRHYRAQSEMGGKASKTTAEA